MRYTHQQRTGLLHATAGTLTGATYANLHGTLFGLRLAAFVALAAAVYVLWKARSAGLARSALLAFGVYAAVSIIGVNVYPSLINRLVVAPNELAKETPQLARHIEATRTAWVASSAR